jgi:hypothetical protein
LNRIVPENRHSAQKRRIAGKQRELGLPPSGHKGPLEAEQALRDAEVRVCSQLVNREYVIDRFPVPHIIGFHNPTVSESRTTLP